MKIYNNTQNEIGYTISSPGDADCGTIQAQQTADFPYLDNTDNVSLGFVALPPEPRGVAPYSVTIPQSGEGMTVTIGLYQE